MDVRGSEWDRHIQGSAAVGRRQVVAAGKRRVVAAGKGQEAVVGKGQLAGDKEQLAGDKEQHDLVLDMQSPGYKKGAGLLADWMYALAAGSGGAEEVAEDMKPGKVQPGEWM